MRMSGSFSHWRNSHIQDRKTEKKKKVSNIGLRSIGTMGKEPFAANRDLARDLPTGRIVHTTTFLTPAVEHWVEQKVQLSGSTRWD